MIEGHLLVYVKRGLLAVENVMDKDKIRIIREFMLDNPDLKGAALKLALGEDYSYGEIRMVYNSMNFEE